MGVMLPNVSALPLTWLALARLGAVMVPINIAYTPREVDYVIVDGEVGWLVIDNASLAILSGIRAADAVVQPSRLRSRRRWT